MISNYDSINEIDILKRKYIILFPLSNLISLLIGYIIGYSNKDVIIINTNSTL